MDIFYNNLPNYLKKYLVSILVDRDYKCKLNLDYYNSTGQFYNSGNGSGSSSVLKGFIEFNQNNILSYSLVSKDWFQWCSNSINIIDSLFIFNDYDNHQYSLIKLNNIESFIQCGLDESSNEIYKTENEILNNFKNLKEILHILPFDLIDNNNNNKIEIRIKDFNFLNSNFSNNNNNNNNNNLSSRIRLTIFKMYDDLNDKINIEKLFLGSFNNNIIDTLKFTYLSSNLEVVKEIISKFNSKRLIIDDELDYWNNHFNFNGLFNSVINSKLEYLSIKGQFTDPHSLIGCSKYLPNLKGLSVLFHFHDLIFNMQRLDDSINKDQLISHLKNNKNCIGYFIKKNEDEQDEDDEEEDDVKINKLLLHYSKYDDDDNNQDNNIQYRRGICDCSNQGNGGCINRTKYTINDWLEFCKSISNLKQLKSLKISEICNFKINNRFLINGKLPNYFIDPLISIINSTTSINYLSLTKMKYLINERLLSSLLLNKSIVYLNLSKSISNSNLLSYLFNEILLNNSNIKYLKLLNLPIDCESLVLEFQKNKNYKLYSFTYSFSNQ